MICTCPNIPTTTYVYLLLLLAVIYSPAVFAAETKMPERPTKIIPARCDLKERETSAQGQFVCRYICNNPDKSKIALVYSNSGLSQCRTAIERTLKVVIK